MYFSTCPSFFVHTQPLLKIKAVIRANVAKCPYNNPPPPPHLPPKGGIGLLAEAKNSPYCFLGTTLELGKETKHF
jgi:hypothetical protein